MYAQILKHVPVFCMLLAFLIVVFAITFGMLSLKKKTATKITEKKTSGKKKETVFFLEFIKDR